MSKSYRIVRYYFRDDHPSLTIKEGCTLEEAQEHCDDPETSSRTATSPEAKEYTQRHGPWFDGYEEEA